MTRTMGMVLTSCMLLVKAAVFELGGDEDGDGVGIDGGAGPPARESRA